MSDLGDPGNVPERPSESSLWKAIGFAALAILAGMILWWAFGLSGNAASRDTDGPSTEPLEPTVAPTPTFPEPAAEILAA